MSPESALGARASGAPKTWNNMAATRRPGDS